MDQRLNDRSGFKRAPAIAPETRTPPPGEWDPPQSKEQTDWESRLGPDEKKEPAFRFVKDNPRLPRVLLLGDSISIGYTETVRNALEGKANVHRIPENGGDTRRGLDKLNVWLGRGTWDVIHFNFGLHDLKHMKDSKLDLAGEPVATPALYQANLEKLAVELKATAAALIWATTTPVPEGAAGRLKGDDVLFNAAARTVMDKHGIRVNDLYAAVLPRLAELQTPRNVHFNAAGYAFLGRQVAAAIEKALPSR